MQLLLFKSILRYYREQYEPLKQGIPNGVTKLRTLTRIAGTPQAGCFQMDYAKDTARNSWNPSIRMFPGGIIQE